MDKMTAPVVFPDPESAQGVACHDRLPAQDGPEGPDTLRPSDEHPEGDPPPVITGGTRMLEEQTTLSV